MREQVLTRDIAMFSYESLHVCSLGGPREYKRDVRQEYMGTRNTGLLTPSGSACYDASCVQSEATKLLQFVANSTNVGVEVCELSQRITAGVWAVAHAVKLHSDLLCNSS